VDLRREVREQKGHGVVHGARLDRVVVVEHHDDVAPHGCEVREEARQDGVDGCAGLAPRLGSGADADAGHGRAAGRHEVRQEVSGVVVPRVQG